MIALLAVLAIVALLLLAAWAIGKLHDLSITWEHIGYWEGREDAESICTTTERRWSSGLTRRRLAARFQASDR